MAAGPSPLTIARGAVKVIAIGVGFCATLIGLMACVGYFFASGWLRFGVALVVAIAVPAVIVDRLLPDDDPAQAKGMVTEVFALSLMGFTVVFVVLLGGLTKNLLLKEGDRLTAAGFELMGKGAYLLAGVRAEPSASPETPGSARASGSAPAALPSGGAPALPPPTDGGLAPDAERPAPKKDEGELTPAELFKKLAPAVVSISFSSTIGSEGGGTGFLIDDRGTIATNYHVISGAKELRIKFMNGAIYEEVDLLDEDSSQDLALLAVNLKKPKEGKKPDAEPLALGDSDKVQVGERAISIGNPLGLEHTLTDGLISARRVYEGKHWIQMSVPVSPGNSGGPLFNLKGDVVGVTTAQVAGGLFGRAQNLNLAVPVNVLKSHIKPSYPGRRKFGTQGRSSHW